MFYAWRYVEAYDLPYPKYEAWLNIHHPNAKITKDAIALSLITDIIVPSSLTDVTASSSITDLNGSLNITPVPNYMPVSSPTNVCSF